MNSLLNCEGASHLARHMLRGLSQQSRRHRCSGCPPTRLATVLGEAAKQILCLASPATSSDSLQLSLTALPEPAAAAAAVGVPLSCPQLYANPVLST